MLCEIVVMVCLLVATEAGSYIAGMIGSLRRFTYKFGCGVGACFWESAL